MEKNKEYNKKAFLLPDSKRSVSIDHANIMDGGLYVFCVYDCITGILLYRDLTNPEEVKEAVEKLRCLSQAATDFADFIEANFVETH